MNTEHLAKVQKVLDALPDTAEGDLRDVALCAVLLEDAYAAVTIGMGLGLTMQRIRECSRDILHVKTSKSHD